MVITSLSSRVFDSRRGQLFYFPELSIFFYFINNLPDTLCIFQAGISLKNSRKLNVDFLSFDSLH